MRQIVLIATDCPEAILANQNKPSPKDAPKGEYCAIKASGSKRQHGQAIIRKSNTGIITSPIGDVYDLDHAVAAQVVADVTINFYRGNANDYAMQLFQANKRPDISELLFINKVGWVGVNPINDLTALQSEDWETRAQIVVRLAYEQISTVTTNAIYQIPFEIRDFDSGDNVIIEGIEVLPNP